MRYSLNFKQIIAVLLVIGGLYGCASDREMKRKTEMEELQKKFSWWPTDAKPAPIKDQERQGYWWWPKEPGTTKLWGNRGYVYVYKIIFDYKEEELPPAKPQEPRPSLLIKKIIKNVKIYFDYNKSHLRDDAKGILESAVAALNKNPQASILITGNCDRRGTEAYNEKLGRKRADSVKAFMLDKGIDAERIRIVSKGKLDAVAPVSDLVGMQKDRNAQFMVAEVDEIMVPAPGAPQVEGARLVEEGKYVVEKEEQVESKVKVSRREYTVEKGDTLWKIAEKELGKGYRWKYIYELNKDKIKDPNRLKAGTKITIPVE
ncbi:LysM peptidoglycan-binding domain-containing protein [bacterium]|nr:MAG: LysM peptidoglycan-binding domain-containing protein [bacterium]